MIIRSIKVLNKLFQSKFLPKIQNLKYHLKIGNEMIRNKRFINPPPSTTIHHYHHSLGMMMMMTMCPGMMVV